MAFADRIYEEYPHITHLTCRRLSNGTNSASAIIGNQFFKMPLAGLSQEGVVHASEAAIIQHLHQRGFPVPELLADHGDFFVTTVATGRHLSPTECPPPEISGKIAKFIFELRHAFGEFEVASLGIPQSSGTQIADSETSKALLQKLEETGSLNVNEITFLRSKIALIEQNRDILEKSVLYNDWKLENFFVDADTVTVVDLGRITKRKCLFEEFTALYRLLPHALADQIIKAYETLSGTEIPEKDLIQKDQINDGNGWQYGGYSLNNLNKKLCNYIDSFKDGRITLDDVATKLREHIQFFGNGPAPVLQKNRGDRSFFSLEYL